MLNYYLPLCVNLTAPEIRHHYAEHEKMTLHDTVLRPLLNKSEIAYAFGLNTNSDLYLSNESILIKDNRKFIIDKSQECFEGHEYFWNATSWKRGSIIMVFNEGYDFTSVFKFCYSPGVLASPSSGNSSGAVKKCKQVMSEGKIAICLSASNGVEWMSIYANEVLKEKIYQMAYENCMDRDRWA